VGGGHVLILHIPHIVIAGLVPATHRSAWLLSVTLKHGSPE
jgi:hypothetical protein